MSNPADRLLDAARSLLGMRENPPRSNRCRVTDWYGLVGPWCDMAVSYAAHLADIPEDVIEKSAYVPARLARARRRGEANRRPAVGALVCYDWGGDGVADHIGLVERVTGSHSFIAIEGNTSPDDRGSQSNGGGMYRRRRVTQQVAGFIHPPYSRMEDDMPLTQADADLVAKTMLAKLAGWVPPTGESPAPNFQTVVTRDHADIGRILNKVSEHAPPVDVDALAAALAKLLPSGVGIDSAELAGVVADELAKRLVR